MTDFSSRVLNLRPDPIDPRDRDYVARRYGVSPPDLPDSIDYSGRQVGPVVDQGATGSCVGQACASYYFWLRGELVSARWIWMGAKEIDPWMPSVCFENAGTLVRDAFKVLQTYGACLHAYWPWDEQLREAELEAMIVENALEMRGSANTIGSPMSTHGDSILLRVGRLWWACRGRTRRRRGAAAWASSWLCSCGR